MKPPTNFHAIVAAGGWNLSTAFLSAKAKAQARDSKGRFIPMGGMVRWMTQEGMRWGFVVGKAADGKTIHVQEPGKSVVAKVGPKQLEVVKALIPKTPAEAKQLKDAQAWAKKVVDAGGKTSTSPKKTDPAKAKAALNEELHDQGMGYTADDTTIQDMIEHELNGPGNTITIKPPSGSEITLSRATAKAIIGDTSDDAKATIPDAPPHVDIKADDLSPIDDADDVPALYVDTTGFKKVGGQSGSNQGGVYEGPDGTQYYVKKAQTEQHAANEVLAAKLYQAAGIGVPEVYLTEFEDGSPAVASKIVPDMKPMFPSGQVTHEKLKKAQAGFAMDAWLSNWDSVGLVYDNLMVDKDGNPVRVDTGGALLYRAQGSPKGGLFGDTVGETETLRDPGMNPQAAKIFGSMMNGDITQAVADTVNKVPDELVDKLVDELPFSSDAVKADLKTKLKNRKADLNAKFNVPAPVESEPEAVIPETPDEKPALKAEDLDFVQTPASELVSGDIVKESDGYWQVLGPPAKQYKGGLGYSAIKHNLDGTKSTMPKTHKLGSPGEQKMVAKGGAGKLSGAEPPAKGIDTSAFGPQSGDVNPDGTVVTLAMSLNPGDVVKLKDGTVAELVAKGTSSGGLPFKGLSGPSAGDTFSHSYYKANKYNKLDADAAAIAKKGSSSADADKPKPTASESPGLQKIEDAPFQPPSVSFTDELTEDEYDAVDEYTGDSYHAINSYLRGNLPKSMDPQDIETISAHLETAISKGKSDNDATLFRGIGDGASFLNEQLAPGTVLEDKGFMSTSSYATSAKSFGTVFEIEVPGGTPMLDVSKQFGHTGEKEFILPRNSKIEIVEDTVLPDGKRYIRSKLVSGGTSDEVIGDDAEGAPAGAPGAPGLDGGPGDGDASPAAGLGEAELLAKLEAIRAEATSAADKVQAVNLKAGKGGILSKDDIFQQDAAYAKLKELRVQAKPFMDALWAQKKQDLPALADPDKDRWSGAAKLAKGGLTKVGALDEATWDKYRDMYVVNDPKTLQHNASLRSDKPAPASKAWATKVDQMVAQHQLKDDSLLYRGGAFSPEFLATLVPGSVLDDKGFQSTGDLKDAHFYGENRVSMKPGTKHAVFEIQVPAGQSVTDVGYGEYVLPRNSKMLIKSVREGDGSGGDANKEGVVYLTAELAPNGDLSKVKASSAFPKTDEFDAADAHKWTNDSGAVVSDKLKIPAGPPPPAPPVAKGGDDEPSHPAAKINAVVTSKKDGFSGTVVKVNPKSGYSLVLSKDGSKKLWRKWDTLEVAGASAPETPTDGDNDKHYSDLFTALALSNSASPPDHVLATLENMATNGDINVGQEVDADSWVADAITDAYADGDLVVGDAIGKAYDALKKAAGIDEGFQWDSPGESPGDEMDQPAHVSAVNVLNETLSSPMLDVFGQLGPNDSVEEKKDWLLEAFDGMADADVTLSGPELEAFQGLADALDVPLPEQNKMSPGVTNHPVADAVIGDEFLYNGKPVEIALINHSQGGGSTSIYITPVGGGTGKFIYVNADSTLPVTKKKTSNAPGFPVKTTAALQVGDKVSNINGTHVFTVTELSDNGGGYMVTLENEDGQEIDYWYPFDYKWKLFHESDPAGETSVKLPKKPATEVNVGDTISLDEPPYQVTGKVLEKSVLENGNVEFLLESDGNPPAQYIATPFQKAKIHATGQGDPEGTEFVELPDLESGDLLYNEDFEPLGTVHDYEYNDDSGDYDIMYWNMSGQEKTLPGVGYGSTWLVKKGGGTIPPPKGTPAPTGPQTIQAKDLKAGDLIVDVDGDAGHIENIETLPTGKLKVTYKVDDYGDQEFTMNVDPTNHGYFKKVGDGAAPAVKKTGVANVLDFKPGDKAKSTSGNEHYTINSVTTKPNGLVVVNYTSKEHGTTFNDTFNANTHAFHWDEDAPLDVTPPVATPSKKVAEYKEGEKVVWDGKPGEISTSEKSSYTEHGDWYLSVDFDDGSYTSGWVSDNPDGTVKLVEFMGSNGKNITLTPADASPTPAPTPATPSASKHQVGDMVPAGEYAPGMVLSTGIGGNKYKVNSVKPFIAEGSGEKKVTFDLTDVDSGVNYPAHTLPAGFSNWKLVKLPDATPDAPTGPVFPPLDQKPVSTPSSEIAPGDIIWAGGEAYPLGKILSKKNEWGEGGVTWNIEGLNTWSGLTTWTMYHGDYKVAKGGGTSTPATAPESPAEPSKPEVPTGTLVAGSSHVFQDAKGKYVVNKQGHVLREGDKVTTKKGESGTISKFELDAKYAKVKMSDGKTKARQIDTLSPAGGGATTAPAAPAKKAIDLKVGDKVTWAGKQGTVKKSEQSLNDPDQWFALVEYDDGGYKSGHLPKTSDAIQPAGAAPSASSATLAPGKIWTQTDTVKSPDLVPGQVVGNGKKTLEYTKPSTKVSGKQEIKFVEDAEPLTVSKNVQQWQVWAQTDPGIIGKKKPNDLVAGDVVELPDGTKHVFQSIDVFSDKDGEIELKFQDEPEWHGVPENVQLTIWAKGTPLDSASSSDAPAGEVQLTHNPVDFSFPEGGTVSVPPSGKLHAPQWWSHGKPVMLDGFNHMWEIDPATGTPKKIQSNYYASTLNSDNELFANANTADVEPNLASAMSDDDLSGFKAKIDEYVLNGADGYWGYKNNFKALQKWLSSPTLGEDLSESEWHSAAQALGNSSIAGIQSDDTHWTALGIELLKARKKHTGTYPAEWAASESGGGQYHYNQNERKALGALGLSDTATGLVTQKYASPVSFPDAAAEIYALVSDADRASVIDDLFGKGTAASIAKKTRGAGFRPALSANGSPYAKTAPDLPKTDGKNGTIIYLGDNVIASDGQGGKVQLVTGDGKVRVLRADGTSFTRKGTQFVVTGSPVTAGKPTAAQTAEAKPYVSKPRPEFTLPDWTKGNVGGTSTAADALAKIKASEKDGNIGWSFAGDGSQVEELDVRLQRVRNKQGGEFLEIRFKLTPKQGNAMFKRHSADPSTWSESHLQVDARQVSENGKLAQLTGANYHTNHQGRTLIKKSASGTEIRFHRANSKEMSTSGGNPTAYHNLVQIRLPADATPADIAKAMYDAGVDDPSPATPAAVRRLGENKLLSMFARKTDAWVGNDSVANREKLLEEIKKEWGVTADDLSILHGTNGRFELRLPEAVADKIAQKTGVNYFIHSLHSGESDLYQKIGQNPFHALLASAQRELDGVIAGGMSKTSDIYTGGADYVFTRPKATMGGMLTNHIVYDAKRLFRRMDWFTRNSDAYGKRSSNMNIVGDTSSSSTETMFKHRMSFDDAIGYLVGNETHRQSLIKTVKSHGITHFGSRTVEEFIIVAPNSNVTAPVPEPETIPVSALVDTVTPSVGGAPA